MSQHHIISVNIINCVQEGASLITEKGAVKEKVRTFFNIKATQTK